MQKRNGQKNGKDKIDEFNHKYMETPLTVQQQVLKTIRQHEKKDYQYKCKDQPMCNQCAHRMYNVEVNNLVWVITFEHQVE